MPAFAGMTVGNIYLLRKKKLCYFDIQFIGKSEVRMLIVGRRAALQLLNSLLVLKIRIKGR
jgi:hypothetical protein